jgi:hypothetical protein
MDLRKEIQVALNNCQPNTNRVDKIEAIAQKYAELYHALQLQQTGVIKSVCEIEKEFEKCPISNSRKIRT